MDSKHFSGWFWLWFSTGLATVIGLITYTGINQWAVVAMALGGAACFTKASYDLGWMKAPYPIGVPLRVALILIAIWGSMGFLAYKVWPSSSAGFMQLGQVWFPSKRFEANKPMSVNLWMKNGGRSPLYEVFPYFGASIVPVGPSSEKIDSNTHATFLKDALTYQVRQINAGDAGEYVGKGEGMWQTLTFPNLTVDQVNALMTGQMRLYVYEWSRWRDSAHDLDKCIWLQPPPTPDVSDFEKLIWHSC